MATSIMDGVLALVTPEMKQALASRLGESPTAIQSGLGTAAAATLGGLVSKAGDGNFLGQIMNLVSGTSGQNILGSLSALGSTGPTGGVSDLVSKFLPAVFGNQQNQVTSLLTQKAGISATSATSLLQTAVPLILGFFAKMHASGSLNVGSLGSMLTAEGPNLQKYVPASLLGSRRKGSGRRTCGRRKGQGHELAGHPRHTCRASCGVVRVSRLARWQGRYQAGDHRGHRCRQHS